MEQLLDRLSPGQIVAVISVVCGCVVGLAMIVAITKYQFQALADDTTLKREKLQAGIAYRQKLLERGEPVPPSLDELLAPETETTPRGSGVPDESLNAGLAKRLGSLEADGREIEETLRQAMAADPARKQAIIEVLDELLGMSAPPAAVLAAVRPLCTSTASAPKPTTVA